MSKQNSIDTDEAKIDSILERSVASILPTREGLKKALQGGKRLKIYIGADVTGPELHLGHATNFLMLEEFRKLGHEIVILFGDFTAMIGDPSDKEAARKQLKKQEIDENIQTWKKQVSAIVDFNDKKNPAKILKNSEWLSKLGFSEIINIASNFTVQHMVERDMFAKRLRSQKPIYLHEFLYPLMQGYDSVAMDVDVEVGGTDQTFNMLAGRTLQKRINNKEKFVITTTLLENPKTGKKLMSKSEGTYIALNDTSHNMFGKVMALPDEIIVQMFVDTTRLSMDEIEKIKKDLKSGVNPRDIKMKLALEIVKLYHGSVEAKEAEENFITTFQKGEVSISATEVTVKRGTSLYDAVGGEVESKSELRRLIENGAVSEVGGEKITDFNFIFDKNVSIKIGKKRFIKVIIE